MVELTGTLVLVGAGKMGGAMLEGWLKGGADPARVVALDPAPPQEVQKLLANKGVRLNPPVSGITDAEVVVVAVKPQIPRHRVDLVGPLLGARIGLDALAGGFGCQAAVQRL